MVLVAYILANHVRILQTKCGNREGHKARRVGLETMPLDHDMEGGHGARQARLKIRPDPVHDPLEMADERQHGAHRFDQQAVWPLAALPPCEVRWIAFRGMEGGITEDNHLFFTRSTQP